MNDQLKKPATDAGRWLLDHWGLANHPSGDAIEPRDAILAIEREAGRKMNAETMAQTGVNVWGWDISRARQYAEQFAAEYDRLASEPDR